MSALDKILDSTFFDEWPEYIKEAKSEVAKLRADLAQAQQRITELTAECYALSTELDAIHCTINHMCGTDTSTIEAVQHVVNERDAARTERDAARAQLATYQRREALRQ